MLRFVLFSLFVNAALAVHSQITLPWDALAQVRFEGQYDPSLGIEVQTATFSDHLKSLEGKEIFISGFMIPIDPLGTRYVISRFPNANCFFCGNAGPETIIELRLLPAFVKRYATDTFATFKGTLQLNEENRESFNYVLLDAEKI